MTDNKTKKAEEKNESFDQFLKFRKANLDIQHIENLAQNGSPDEKNKANNEIRDLAYKLAKDVAPVSVGARTKEQFNDPNEIHGYMDALKVINQSNYSKFFEADRAKRTISAIPNATLERMVESENSENPFLMSSTDDKGRMVYQAYRNVSDIKAKAKRFEEGRLANEDERKEYLTMAAIGAGKEQSDRIRAQNKKGKKDDKAVIVSEDVIQVLGNLAERAVLSGYATHDSIKKYVVSGAKAQVEQAKKIYDSAVEKKGADVYGVTRESIEKLAKDIETRVPIMDRLYQAHSMKK